MFNNKRVADLQHTVDSHRETIQDLRKQNEYLVRKIDELLVKSLKAGLERHDKDIEIKGLEKELSTQLDATNTNASKGIVAEAQVEALEKDLNKCLALNSTQGDTIQALLNDKKHTEKEAGIAKGRTFHTGSMKDITNDQEALKAMEGRTVRVFTNELSVKGTFHVSDQTGNILLLIGERTAFNKGNSTGTILSNYDQHITLKNGTLYTEGFLADPKEYIRLHLKSDSEPKNTEEDIQKSCIMKENMNLKKELKEYLDRPVINAQEYADKIKLLKEINDDRENLITTMAKDRDKFMNDLDKEYNAEVDEKIVSIKEENAFLMGEMGQHIKNLQAELKTLKEPVVSEFEVHMQNGVRDVECDQVRHHNDGVSFMKAGKVQLHALDNNMSYYMKKESE